MTQPLPGKIYSAECEIEIRTSYSCDLDEMQCGETCHGNLSNKIKCTFCTVRQVARLKPKEVIFPAANSHDMKEEEKCTLSDKELVEAIHQLVSKQCKTGNGWLMSVPVDFNRDSDMLISELIKRFEFCLKK